jgi:hypothetical protein
MIHDSRFMIKTFLSLHNDIIIAELSVIPACLESFSEEGCPESVRDMTKRLPYAT